MALSELLGFKVFEVGPFHFVAPNETVACGLFLHQVDDENFPRNEEKVTQIPMDQVIPIWTDEKGAPAEPEGRGNKLENQPAREWIRRFLRTYSGMSGLLCLDSSEI